MRARVLLLAALAVSCADVSGLDDFRQRTVSESAATATEYFGLRFTMLTMKPHAGHMLEYRVVDANNYVQFRGVVRTLAGQDITLEAPRAIPRLNPPYRLDFYADVNESGGFDGLGSVITNDHAWRIEPLVSGAEPLAADDVVHVTFQHSTSFTNIDQYPSGTPNPPADTGLPAKVRVEGLGAALGKMLQVRIAERASGHAVGLYRVPLLDAAAIDAVVPGCVDVETEYEIDVYVDANGNGAYDDPRAEGGDRGWRVRSTSGASGLDIVVDLASATSGDGKVDVGPP